jgi:hypothetical protein
MSIFKIVFYVAMLLPGESLWHSGMSDQEKCQAEANYMAKYNIRGHVFFNIGGFEGVGYGNSKNVQTCQPRRPMRLTGDASARSSSGVWFRVRSWR